MKEKTLYKLVETVGNFIGRVKKVYLFLPFLKIRMHKT